MRVAFFVQYCHEGGTYFRWHNLARALQIHGVTVDIYAGDFNYKAKSRIEIRDGVKYIITPSLLTSRIFGNPSDPFTAVYRWFKTPLLKYDAVHLFQPFIQAFLPWLKYKNKTKAFYDWDDLWTNGIFKERKNFRDYYTFTVVSYLEKKLLKLALKITTCSYYLQEIAGIQKAVLIYNGYWPSIQPVKAVANNFLKDPDYIYAGYIGRTAAEIDWLTLLAQKVEQENLMCKIVIAGISEQQMKEAGLLINKTVLYLGNLSPDEASSVIRALDIALMPMENSFFNQSRFPIKLFDYLTACIPVYCSSVGMLKPIIEKNNFLINGGIEKNEWVNNFLLLNKNFNLKNLKTQVHFDNNVLREYEWQIISSNLLLVYNS